MKKNFFSKWHLHFFKFLLVILHLPFQFHLQKHKNTFLSLQKIRIWNSRILISGYSAFLEKVFCEHQLWAGHCSRAFTSVMLLTLPQHLFSRSTAPFDALILTSFSKTACERVILGWPHHLAPRKTKPWKFAHQQPQHWYMLELSLLQSSTPTTLHAVRSELPTWPSATSVNSACDTYSNLTAFLSFCLAPSSSVNSFLHFLFLCGLLSLSLEVLVSPLQSEVKRKV